MLLLNLEEVQHHFNIGTMNFFTILTVFFNVLVHGEKLVLGFVDHKIWHGTLLERQKETTLVTIQVR